MYTSILACFIAKNFYIIEILNLNTTFIGLSSICMIIFLVIKKKPEIIFIAYFYQKAKF